MRGKHGDVVLQIAKVPPTKKMGCARILTASQNLEHSKAREPFKELGYSANHPCFHSAAIRAKPPRLHHGSAPIKASRTKRAIANDAILRRRYPLSIFNACIANDRRAACGFTSIGLNAWL
jgi:hypothetical protein